MTIQYTPKPADEAPVEENNKNNPGTKIEKDNKKIQEQEVKNVEYPPKVKYL